MSKEYLNGQETKTEKAKGFASNKNTILLSVVIVLLLAIVVSLVIIFRFSKTEKNTETQTQSTASVNESSQEIDRFPQIDKEAFGNMITTQTTTASDNSGLLAVPPTQDGTFNVEKTIISFHNGTTNKDATTRTEVESGELYHVVTESSLDKSEDTVKRYIIDNSEELGINKEKAEEMIRSGTTWKQVVFFVYVLNSSSKGIAMRDVKAKQNESLLVDTTLECEVGIPMGRGMYIPVEVYVDTSRYGTEEEIVSALRDMEINVAYTFIDDPMKSVDDWSKVDIMYMPLKF